MSVRPDLHRPLPPVDARLVAPETRYEIIDGELTYVSPADPPHASRHSKISAILEAYVAPGYDVASDMLTRTSELGDMAPDASVYPLAPDPETGGRQIERLAFEVVSTERIGAAERKAERLAERGVGRVFAVDVVRARVLEWHAATAGWSVLPGDGVIVDPALVGPLPVGDLLAASADDAMARALLAKENPVLADAVDAGREAGRREGRIEALLLILGARGFTVSADRQRTIATAEVAQLDGWLVRAGACASVEELLSRTD
jgi:Uma2 family endonuclease